MPIEHRVCKHAEKEFQKAGVGLGKAKADFKTTGIDVVATRANKASAETSKARVELLRNNPSFRHSNRLSTEDRLHHPSHPRQ